MKFIPLIWAGLRRKLSRSILILAQVIIAFTLFGVLQGLTSGINHAIASTHPDRLYVGSKLNLGFPIPIAIVAWVKSLPGVIGVAPRYQFGAAYQRPTQGVGICATDVDAYFVMYPEDAVDAAQQRALRQVRDGVIVGIGTMHKYGWKVGQRVTLQSQLKGKDGTGNWTFDVVGTWKDTEDENEDDAQLLLAHYDYINESLPEGPGRDTMNLAVLRIADPARAAAIEQKIDAQYTNSSNETLTQSEQELVQAEVSNFGDIDTVAHRIVGATLFVLLFATGALMMQSIRERTPELAVLKTVGFSDRSVMFLILGETLVLCLVGAALGLELGVRILPVAREEIGTVTVPPSVFLMGLGFALVLALAGGAMAGWRGLRLRVVDALANR
ncbi:MAG TPA: FtsX-like permease family protein [Steroidobacteraceae bacterium]|jgi:putative ABC transport system permease protein|nr:FtsX-like permease family protein [Steroidobacteraceae bacterium]